LRDWLTHHYGARVEIVGGEIGDPAIRKEYLKAAENLGGKLYGLVCLSGNPARVKFEHVEIEDLHESMQVNYYGPVLLARETARLMRSRKISGSIVFFSTMQAVAAFSSSINYAVPKAALVHAARVLAKELGGPEYIRVNVVAPGVNKAGMALTSIASGKYDHFVEQGIIPRFGRAEDIARVVRLLMEPDSYITGQTITVDGGLTLRRDLA
jgi:NAD(P)-dependent dehydrogenase (short-subunit alcohol dehydrogenase family)